MSTEGNLSGRTAIVTGAGRGIGRTIADRLSRAGARVAVVDVDARAAETASAEIGASALALTADVSSSRDVDRLVVDLSDRWGRIDILVNNAGIVGVDAPVWELQEADWNRVMDINLKSVFLCSRAVVPHMMKRKQGAIVSMASISGKEGNPNMAPYSVSKAGIICFTKALAKEVLPFGIRVNCIAPALIETPLTESLPEARRNELMSKIPMGRLGKREEVAALIHFLASDDAAFTTGQCYDISGGRATY